MVLFEDCLTISQGHKAAAFTVTIKTKFSSCSFSLGFVCDLTRTQDGCKRKSSHSNIWLANAGRLTGDYSAMT